MKYQIAMRNGKSIGIGVGESPVAELEKAGFLVQNLKGTFEGSDYELKLPAPWTGFRYRLHRGDAELANAKRENKLRAPDPEQPYVRHRYVDFHLEVEGRSLLLQPEDRWARIYRLLDGDEELGRFAMRNFERDDQWTGDVELPEGWTVPLAAFVAWLAWEGQHLMNR